MKTEESMTTINNMCIVVVQLFRCHLCSQLTFGLVERGKIASFHRFIFIKLFVIVFAGSLLSMLYEIEVFFGHQNAKHNFIVRAYRSTST